MNEKKQSSFLIEFDIKLFRNKFESRGSRMNRGDLKKNNLIDQSTTLVEDI